MKLVSWNLNSARARAELLAEFLDDERPDVIALQETKCVTAQFPSSVLLDRGYDWAHQGEPGRNGVALAAKARLEDIEIGFGGSPTPPFDEARLITATVGDMRIVSLYAPNGRRRGTDDWHQKLAWFKLLQVWLELELADHEQLVVLGDFNVCPTTDDCYDPNKRNRNLVSDEERAAFAQLLDLGLVDIGRSLHGAETGYTWFAQQRNQFEAGRGYRLDIALATPNVTSRAESCQPLLQWRDPTRRPSDHAPLELVVQEPD